MPEILKEGADHDLAVSMVKEEYENHKKSLDRKRMKYKIVDEKIQDDDQYLLRTY